MFSFALYIQGNFVLINYGELNGKSIDWSKYTINGIISNILFWIFPVVGIVLIIKKKNIKKIIGYISAFIFLIQLVTLGALLIQKDHYRNVEEYVSTTKNEFSFSKNENVIILLLDTFDSKFLEHMLEENPDQYKTILEDFTYFPDTVGNYSATDLAVPQMLTGEAFYHDVSYDEYINDAFYQSNLLNTFRDKGWNNYIYTIEPLPQSGTVDSIINLEKKVLTVSSHKRLLIYMYKYVGFRYAPQMFKQAFWFYSDDMAGLKDIKSSTEQIFDWSNFIFYDGINDIKAEQENNVFSFCHLEGAHSPFTITKDFTIEGRETSAEEESRAMMLLVDKFLRKLKETDIYNNSAIVIMADHGFYGINQNPLFLVKGMQESHEMQCSDKSLSLYMDFGITLNNLSNGEEALDAVVDRIGEDRIFYRFDSASLQSQNDIKQIIEFKTNGKAFDYDRMKETGIVYE